MTFPNLCNAGGSVNEFKLSNGLRVLHKKIDQNPLVTVQVFINSGVKNETEKEAGIANFAESLLFQGTKKRTSEQIAKEIEDIGGNISSDVDYDFTNLNISLLNSHIEKGMEIVVDILANPTFEETQVEKERLNILASIRDRQDHIFNVADDLLIKSFYGSFPYSWPETGKKETVSGITRNDLLKWHRENYTAGNMVLVIVGDIELADAKNYAETYFSAIPAGSREAGAAVVKTPKKNAVRFETDKFKQAYLMYGFPAPSINSPDHPVLKCINSMIGSRMSGRLFVQLREELGLAYEVNAFYPSRLNLSRFVIYIGLDKKNLELAKTKIFEILKDLRENPVSKSELEETKSYIRGVYLLDHQTIGKKAWYMGWWETMGLGYGYDEKYFQKLMSVTPEDIQRTANKYFDGIYTEVDVTPK
jgi:zinc protease